MCSVSTIYLPGARLTSHFRFIHYDRSHRQEHRKHYDTRNSSRRYSEDKLLCYKSDCNEMYG